MNQEVIVALSTNDGDLAKQILSEFADLADVEVLAKYDADGAVPENPPNVVIFHDQSEPANLLSDIARLRQDLPQTAIFVVSADKSTDHVVAVMKAGADEFFANPLNLPRLKEAVEKVRNRIATLAPMTRGKLYSFISAKGGLGSTVISVNVAAALAMKSKESVALLDMSLQSGDSSVYLDTLPQTTLSDICKNFHRLDFSFLKTSMMHHSTGLYYLAAPKNPEDSGSVNGGQVKKVMQLAKSLYDHVVVDCSSMLVDECALEAFRASDRIFLLTDLSVPSIRNAARLNQLMQKVGIPQKKVEVVVNRFIKGGPALPDVEKSLQKKIFWLFPNDFDEVIASINAGTPLVKSNPGTAFAKNVSEFIQKIKNPENLTNYRGARGFLGKAI